MDVLILHPPQRPETVQAVANSVVERLSQAGQTVGVAESLTGGSVMAAITSVPGSSAVLFGGVVSYATHIKQELLRVDGDLIAQEGVINFEVARQMAEGARRIASHGSNQATWGVATTGVAGPTSQDNKPAGTVYIGIASSDKSRAWGPFNFTGDREAVRQATVRESLYLLREVVGNGI
jgi:PncC family amidohydrolase